MTRSVGKVLALAAVIPLGATSVVDAAVHCDGTTCTVSGSITENTTFEAAYTYLLQGPVVVEEPAVLVVEAGTMIQATSDPVGALIISQGAQIRANGTAEAPIVMTSSKPEGERAGGDWGGLVINGRAPINHAENADGSIEHPTGRHGGNDAADDSGHLYYVRIEYAGADYPGDEYGAFAFNGVGSETEVDHIMALQPFNDGLEFVGGTVNVKHVVIFGGEDDALDWDNGWVGKAQFIIIMQDGYSTDQGIEGDNDRIDHNRLPRSHPVMYNLTLIGSPNGAREIGFGMQFFRGSAATIRNFIVMGFVRSAIEINDEATFEQARSGMLSFGSGIIYENCTAEECGDGQFLTGETAALVLGSPYVVEADPALVGPTPENPDFTPMMVSPAVNNELRADVPPYDGFFEVTHYIGAVRSADDTWWQGWTNLHASP